MSDPQQQDVVSPGPQEDERLKLGYEMAKILLAAQDRTVTNLRTRASAMLATAALVVTFSTSVGLLRFDAQKNVIFPQWAAWVMLALIAVQGFLVMFVLWPVKMKYGHTVVEIVDPPKDAPAAAEKPISRWLIEKMRDYLDANKKKIRRMAVALQAAMLLLLAEVAVVITAIALE
ncbi:hypothetical protein [Streptomyces sp. RK9]|uniref:hypothetical protein n=1 Tax=Streptomyces sp. RK9 TaxID=3239284 RepID=UPI0038692E65